MIIDTTCDFGTPIDVLNSMTDAETKEYFESIETDRWVDEYKNNPDLM